MTFKEFLLHVIACSSVSRQQSCVMSGVTWCSTLRVFVFSSKLCWPFRWKNSPSNKSQWNLWTCSWPLVLYVLKRKSESRLRFIGDCWNISMVGKEQIFYFSWFVYLFLILAFGGYWSPQSKACCRDGNVVSSLQKCKFLLSLPGGPQNLAPHRRPQAGLRWGC